MLEPLASISRPAWFAAWARLLAAYGGLALISSAKSASVLALPAGHRAELGVAALVIEHLAATLTLPLGARGRVIAAVVGVMQCPPTEVAHVFAWWPLAIDEARALIAWLRITPAPFDGIGHARLAAHQIPTVEHDATCRLIGRHLTFASRALHKEALRLGKGFVTEHFGSRNSLSRTIHAGRFSTSSGRMWLCQFIGVCGDFGELMME